MNDLTSFTSPWRKTLASLLRGSLWLLLAAMLLFVLVWGVLHVVIVPRISEFRPDLENWTSRKLGVPVRIGDVHARSTGMVPSFELTDVQLFDPAGRAALRLPRVLVALSPRSLVNLGFEQLYVDSPELEIRRAADGKIFIAGLDFSRSSQADTGAVDWFFSQIEFAIHDGSVRWTDELRGVPTLALQHVDLVVRNGRLQHGLRLDATPPAQWGERFTLMGNFRQPLLSTRNGDWREWEGQVYAAAARVDVSQLRRYADLGVDVAQGNGAARAWVDWSRGRVTGASADLALAEVSVTLGKDLQPLDLRSLAGRLELRLTDKGGEFNTRGLQFDTSDGVHWPGGNVRVVYQADKSGTPVRTEVWADKLDLAALSQITNRLPVGARAHAALTAYAPQGLMERIHVSWEGQPDARVKFAAQGRVTQLAIASQPVPGAEHLSGGARIGTPGVRNASVDFDLTEAGGRASLAMQNGAVDLPGVFEDPLLLFASINAEAQWKVNGQQISVHVPSLKFANDDAQGEAQVDWKTRDGATGEARFPGVLDLQGMLSRGDGTRVYRYLPLVLRQEVRDYVHNAVTAGTASGVKFKLKGDLNDMPFADSKQGEFRITANIQNANYAYVPRSLQTAAELPWPALMQASGEFVLDRTQLQLKGVHARIGPGNGLQVVKADANIPDLRNTVVAVTADAKGPLNDLLGLLTGSPLDGMISKALSKASGSGTADYRLKLNLPLAKLEKSTVQGSVTLNNNDFQIRPDVPRLQKARGIVNFSESGFGVVGGQARALGGDVRIEGGLANSVTLVKFQGTATADGLRQAKELGMVAKLAQRASGGAAYTGQLGFKGGELELTVASNLQGMALNLPAPLAKVADTALPLRVEKAVLRDSLTPLPGGQLRLQDQLTVELGRLASASYVRDVSGAEPRVLRGGLRVGSAMDEPLPMPDEGVFANIVLGNVNMDAWSAVATELVGASWTTLTAPGASAGGARGAPEANVALAYLPTSLVVRAGELQVLGGRKLNKVIAGGSREGLTWRANLEAQELNGYAEYRQPSGANPGRVYVRLARLALPPSVEAEVENLLDEQPASIPALDIVVEDFDFNGKKLGRIEVDAVNRGATAAARDGGPREWRLNKFNIITPEAQFTGSGNWATINAQSLAANGSPLPRSLGERRRTVLNFKLDIADAGGVLARFGMKDVVRRGKGTMEGQVAWIGSPLSPDYPSMSGAFNVKVESGQFLKNPPPGLAKLLGVLSLQSLPRRLTLDFKDVFSEGFAFDLFGGDIAIEQGIARTNNLQMKGVNGVVFMDGRADIARETQDIKVVVIPEINAGTASLIATWINPAVGVTTFLGQLFLRKPLIEANTKEFHVEGSWTDPKFTEVDHKPGTGENKAASADKQETTR
jgi:uncharacterized protein (TIGR02099 family)